MLTKVISSRVRLELCSEYLCGENCQYQGNFELQIQCLGISLMVLMFSYLLNGSRRGCRESFLYKQKYLMGRRRNSTYVEEEKLGVCLKNNI